MMDVSMCRCMLMLTVCLAWLTGCGQTVSRAELGPPYMPVAGVRADDLMPVEVFNRGPGRVRVTDDRGENDRPDTSEAIAPDTWRMRVAGYWVVDVTRGPGGAVLILSETELHEGQRVEYTTPLPMLPETLTHGETHRSASLITLYNHESGAQLATGRCEQTITLLGARPIQTPSGEVTATLVQTQRQYKLPLVSVDIDILTAYVPGLGPAAGLNRRVIRFLGLLPVTVEQHIMRVE